MVEQVIKNISNAPTVVSADPGYVTFENYAYLKDNGLWGLIPDSMHFIETHGGPNITRSRDFGMTVKTTGIPVLLGGK